MIVTQKKRIPWWWVFMMALPPLGNSFVEHCSGAPLTFSMKKFIDQPWLIMLLGSVNVAFNFMVAPFIAYQSDRIWTRFGRRKPFIIFGWIGLVISLIFIPLAPNIWILAVVIVSYQFFEDIAFTGPWAPLYNEVVPVPQRGRAAALNSLMGNFTTLYFNFALIGHFDELRRISLDGGLFGWPGVTITGEQLIYWLAAAMVTIMIVHVSLNVKETPVHSPITGERFSLWVFFKSVFGDRQWLMIYVLIFAQVAMHQGLGQLSPLLITEQFGYTKAQMGQLHGWVTILRIAIVIPLAGYFADKIDRVKMFQVTLALATLHHISYWAFIHFIVPCQIPAIKTILDSWGLIAVKQVKEAVDAAGGAEAVATAAASVPAIPTIMAFDVFGSFVNLTGSIALAPLLFDYVPRDRMGTVHAGMSFVRGMIKITVLNGVGLWISCYSWLVMPEGKYDYSSGFLYTTTLGSLGFVASIYFAKLRKAGKIIEYGRMELEVPNGKDEQKGRRRDVK